MEKKEKWSHQRESTITAVGMALGSSTLLIMPYRFFGNGGGLFWIPYLIMEILVGAPLTFMFLSLGQYCSSGILTCWKFAPMCSGIGGSMFILCFLTTLYYAILPAWSLIYLFSTGYLATKECSVSGSLFFNRSSEECYKVFSTFFHETFRGSSNIEELGSVNWKPAIGLLAVYVIVFLFLVLGVRVYGKVAYITATLPFVFMLALLVRGATLEGSNDGVTAVMTANAEKIGKVEAWYGALMTVIFRSSFGHGIFLTLGSYNNFHNDTFRDTLVLMICKIVYSILAIFTSSVFSGYYWNLTQTGLYRYPLTGLSAFFVEMSVIFHTIPATGFWMVLVQITLLCVFFNVVSCSLLTMTTAITDLVPVLRKKIWHTCVLAALCLLLFLLGLPFTTEAGNEVLNYIDTVVGYSIPYLFILCCSCIAVGYFYGILKFSDDIKIMVNDKVLFCLPWIIVKITLIPTVCFITPWLIAIFGGYAAKDNSFDDKFWWTEDWQPPLAKFLVTFIILPIPIAALVICIIRFVTTSGNFFKRLSSPFTPTTEWGPVEIQHRQEVEGHLKKYGFVVDPWGSRSNNTFQFTDLNAT